MKQISPPASPSPPSPASSSHSSIYYELLICIGTTLYGISVVTSRAAMNNGVGPATFNSLQHIVASLSLILFRPLLKKLTANSSAPPLISDQVGRELNENQILLEEDEAEEIEEEEEKRREPLEIILYFERKYPFLKNYSFELIFLSIACALLNFIASSFNQYGLVTVEAGKSAFLTSLYVGFTPMILYFLHGSSAQINSLTWISALVSLFGSYLLAGCDSTNLLDSLSIGEIYTIIGALLWAFVILMTDYAVDRVDCIDLVCLELSISTLFCLLLTLYSEPYGILPLLRFDQLLALDQTLITNWLLIIATGFIEAVAFLLDTIGQIHTSGSRAALLMGLDSLITVVFAFIFLNETLSFIETIGCVLLLSSTLLTTLSSSDEDEEEGEGEELVEEEIEVEEEGQEETERKGDLEDLEARPLPLPLKEKVVKKIRIHRPVLSSEYGSSASSSAAPSAPAVPYHRLKSTPQFAGELRKQSYVLLSRRGLPARTGRRERSHSMHEHHLTHPSRRSKDTSAASAGTAAAVATQRRTSGAPPSHLSSSLPNASSIGYGAMDNGNGNTNSGYGERSQDDSSLPQSRPLLNETSPLLSP
jgi:drug/metabolite transporter (DMT)-like permease